jgi:hypothetical protein
MRPKADGRSTGETSSSCGSTPSSEPRGSGRNASSGRPSTVQQAIDPGELAGAEADQLAFEIEALGEAVIPQSRLLERDAVYARARRAVLDRRALATDPDLLPEE